MVVVSVLKVLWSILGKRDKWHFCALIGLLFFSGLFEMGGMMAIFGFISGLKTSGPEGVRHGAVARLVQGLMHGPVDQVTYVAVGGGAVLAFMVVKNIQSMASQFSMNRFLMKRNLLLSKELFEGYLAAPYELLQPRTLSSVQRRISEIFVVFSEHFSLTAQVIADALTLSMVLALLFWVSPMLTLVCVVTFGGAGSLIYWLLERTLTQMGRTERIAQRDASKFLEQAFGEIVQTRLRDLRGYFVRHYTRAISRTTLIKRRRAALSRLPRSVNEVLLTSMIVSSVLYLSLTGRGVEQALPTLALFGFAGLRMTGSMSRLNNNLQRLRQGHERMQNLAGILGTVSATFSKWGSGPNIGRYTDDERPMLEGRQGQLVHQLRLDDVYFRFPGMKKDILRGVSVEIRRGSFVAFCGPSGGGKTTLLKIIMGLLVPNQGTVSCDDWNVVHHIRAWHKNIGYVGQSIFLTDESVRNNVAFGLPDKEIDDARVKRALVLASAADFVDQLPEGLSTPLLSGQVLSGGQKQRIVIARALYHDPEVLIFDEATAALDNETERDITRAIQQLSGEKTVVCVAHRLSTIRSAQMIHFVAGGRITASGTYDELYASSKAFRSMVRAGEISGAKKKPAAAGVAPA